MCRNRTAENLYGYSAAEALGQDAIELLIDPRDYAVANGIVQRVSMGEKWTGKFPVKNKMAERFTVVATNTPLYDDDGALVGIICVSSDSRPFQEVGVALLDSRNLEAESSNSSPRNIVMSKLGLDSQQPLQAAVASKISNLVSLLVFLCSYVFNYTALPVLIVRITKTGIQGEQQSQVQNPAGREQHGS